MATKTADSPRCKCGLPFSIIPYIKRDKKRGECTCCPRCDGMNHWPRSN